MVPIGDMEPVALKSSMAATPGRASASPLHNFDLPWLRWGTQRFLRCAKLDADGARSDDPPDRRPGSGRRKRKPELGEIEAESGIAAVREKLLIDFQEEVAKFQLEILRNDAGAEEAEPARPWNLRTRRAACQAPAPDTSLPPAKSRPARRIQSPAKKKDEAAAAMAGKFTVALSREEVEADFRAIVGQKPPRRPRKRARVVQKDVDSLSPGFYLREITAERYKLSEFPES